MGHTNSPLGSTNFQSTQPQHYTVPDESDDGVYFQSSEPVVPPEYQQGPAQHPQHPPQHPPQHSPQHAYNPQAQQEQFAEQRRIDPAEFNRIRAQIAQQKAQQQAPSNNDRRKVDILIGAGRLTKDVPITVDGGVITYRIKTLKSKERRRVAQAMDNMRKLKTEESMHEVRDTVLALCIESVDGIPLDDILGSNVHNRYDLRKAFVIELEDNISLYLFNNYNNLNQDSANKYKIQNEDDLKEAAEAIKKSEQGAGE